MVSKGTLKEAPDEIKRYVLVPISKSLEMEAFDKKSTLPLTDKVLDREANPPISRLLEN